MYSYVHMVSSRMSRLLNPQASIELLASSAAAGFIGCCTVLFAKQGRQALHTGANLAKKAAIAIYVHAEAGRRMFGDGFVGRHVPSEPLRPARGL